MSVNPLGHVSRANSVRRELGSAGPSVVMFQGPQAHITPGRYRGKAEHGEVVSTLNQVVARAHGVAPSVEDRDGVLPGRPTPHSTVTDFARFLGLSTSVPRTSAA